MSRNDIPSEKASNFSARLRETIQTMLGTRGDKLDRVVTVRDLIDSGITKLAPGWNSGGTGTVPLLPGPELPAPEVYEPDLTPPPTPSGFTVSAAISHVFIEHDAPIYTQGHGHLRTRLYGVTVQGSDPLPTFSDAVEITQFTGTVHAHPSNPSTTWHLWIKWETVDGVLSPTPAGGTNGLSVTTGQDVSLLLDALTGQITSSELATSLSTPIASIPSIAASTNANAASIAAIQSELATISNTPDYVAGTTYSLDDIVKYNGGLYRALGTTTGNLPTNATYWQKIGDYASLGDAVAAHAVELTDHETRIVATESGLVAEATARNLLAATVANNTAAISSEATTRASADSALSTTINTVSAVANTKNKTYVQTTAPTTGMTTGDLWFDSDANNRAYRYSGSAWVEITDTRIATTAAAVTTETNARIAGDTALANQITTLTSTVNGNTSAIQAEATTRATADSANASAITTVQSNLNTTNANVTTAQNTANTAVSNAAAAQTTANTANTAASTANALLADIAADSKLTPVEKSQVRSEWNVIAAEKSANNTQATSFAITTENTAYNTAFQALANYLNAGATWSSGVPNWIADANLGTTTDIVGATFRANWKAYYDARTALLNAISLKAKTLADAAQTAATNAQSTANNATASIQTEAATRATQTGELYAQYTVKTDVAGLVSGYGLASSANNAAPTSSFGVQASNFFIAPPTVVSATDPIAIWSARQVNAVIAGDIFVAAGDGGYTATSADGLNWVPSASLSKTAWGTTSRVRCLSSTTGLFVAGGDAGGIATSANGDAWTYQTGLRTTTWGTTRPVLALARNSTTFVALGGTGGVATSTNGVAWAYRTSLALTAWGTADGFTLVWNGTIFVAAGALGQVATSSDGITWVHRPSLRATTWGTTAAVNAVAWSGSRFVAVGDGGRAATSLNGIDWTYQSSLATVSSSRNFKAVAWDGAKFVAVGASGGVATSSDGVTWVYQSQLSTTAWGVREVSAVVKGTSRLVAVGALGASATSADGQTWEPTSLADSTSAYLGYVWRDTSVTPNVTRYHTGSAWSTTPQTVPFTVQTVPTTINGVPVPAGVYMSGAFIQNATITNAKIANLAVDDAKIADLSADKLTAGSIAVGQHIQSASYVAGSQGWRINGNGTAEFSGVVVRGTVYATAGTFSGSLQAATGTFSGSLQAATGTFSGSLQAATGTFSGSISAATGTFTGNLHGGQFTTGNFTGYAWPPAPFGGTYLGPQGLLLGNLNNGSYFQVTGSGNIYSPGFRVENGVMTVTQANVINTLNLAGQAVTIPVSAYSASNNSSDLMQSVNIVSTGAPIVISCSAVHAFNQSSSSVILYRDGAAIFATTLGIHNAMIVSFTIIDTPGAGAHTYAFYITNWGSEGSLIPNQGGSNRAIVCLEAKR